MGDQILKDRHGQPRGKIKTLSNGRLEIVDRQGTPVGTYDPKTNKTLDKHGSPIGSGNLLTTLLV